MYLPEFQCSLSIRYTIDLHPLSVSIICIPLSFAVVDCGMLTDPTNGQVMFMTTTYTSTADYTCDTGYNLVGVDQRTCTAAGTWTDGEPTCQSETGCKIIMHNIIINDIDTYILCTLMSNCNYTSHSAVYN